MNLFKLNILKHFKILLKVHNKKQIFICIKDFFFKIYFKILLVLLLKFTV